MKVLVTGFEPFGGDAVNASWEAVRRLAEDWTGSAELVTLRLPVTFHGAADGLGRALALHRPDVVVVSGVAADADVVRLERVAINLADARIPDNDGFQPADEAVVEGGPTAYLSGLPVKDAVAALHAAGIPAAVSDTAGTYVCNATFYVLVHLLTAHPGVRGGFVHVPPTVEQGGGPDGGPRPGALPVATLARALDIVATTALADVAGDREPEALQR